MRQNRPIIDVVFERIPPFLTWVIILFPLWGGFFFADFTAYVILSLNIYFLYKSISVAASLLISVLKIRESEAINWYTRLKQFDDIDTSINDLLVKKDLIEKEKAVGADFSFRRDALNRLLLNRLPNSILNWLAGIEKGKVIKFVNNEINRLRQIKKQGLYHDWHDMRHIVVIPHWKEPYHILESTVKRIIAMNYDKKNLYIMLAAEARDEQGIEMSKKLQAEYGQFLGGIWVNSHELTHEEVIGKSSNMASASQALHKIIDSENWDLKKTTITSCDADSQLPMDYFSNITYLYVTEKDSEYKYYTGAILLYANIWKLPFFARVKNSMSTLYNVAKLIRQDKLVPFSTYTLSFWMINEIEFWSPNVMPEDFHTFFKGLFKYPNKVSTVPIYQKIFSDAAEGDNLNETFKNNYMQERRWAWGISDDGWMLKNVIKNIFSWRFNIRMIYIAAHSIWDHLSIGISILITFGSNFIVLVNPRFSYTVLGSNLPKISSSLIQLTLFFFVVTILLDRYIRPVKNQKKNLVQSLFGFVEWFLQPIVGTMLVVLPGVEAHTRLLFGKYLEYYLTKKK
jgi:hypothetical protein